MSYVDLYTTTIEETGEVILDRVIIRDPPVHKPLLMRLETKFNRNLHGPPELLASSKKDTFNLLISVINQDKEYKKNLRILLQEYTKKMTAQIGLLGGAKALVRAGDDVILGATKLAALVQDRPTQPYREGYLTDIFRHWRTVSSGKEVRDLEDVWVFVAGRPHREE